MVKEIKKQEKVKLSTGFKNKWTEALRSGRYPEGSGMMYNPDTDCYDPIGVAYRVAGVSLKNISKRDFPSGKQYRFLPEALYSNTEFLAKIADFSDRGLSFKWIASYIERNL